MFLEQSQYECQVLWPTPIYLKDLHNAQAINKSLKVLISNSDDGGKEKTTGLFRGRKSDFGLLRYNCEAVPPKKEAIFSAVDMLNRWAVGDHAEDLSDSLIAEAWSVEYGSPGYHRLHVHHGSCWSGVYYVSVGSVEPGTGEVHLIDPRIGAAAQGVSPDKIALPIVPRDGLLIAFPSWLSHWVTPVECTTPRICIAFNIGFSNLNEAF
jgi:uncharacterized protein (TIGR02466 family)